MGTALAENQGTIRYKEDSSDNIIQSLAEMGKLFLKGNSH